MNTELLSYSVFYKPSEISALAMWSEELVTRMTYWMKNNSTQQHVNFQGAVQNTLKVSMVPAEVPYLLEF